MASCNSFLKQVGMGESLHHSATCIQEETAQSSSIQTFRNPSSFQHLVRLLWLQGSPRVPPTSVLSMASRLQQHFLGSQQVRAGWKKRVTKAADGTDPARRPDEAKTSMKGKHRPKYKQQQMGNVERLGHSQ